MRKSQLFVSRSFDWWCIIQRITVWKQSCVCSLFSMPLLGWLSVFDDLTTSQTRAPERVITLNWLSSSTALMAWLLSTCLNYFTASPTFHHEGAIGRLLQTTFSCLCQDLCPSEICRSLLPPQGSGAIYPTTTHLHRHHLVLSSTINWRHSISEVFVILTLFCSLQCFVAGFPCCAMVVLKFSTQATLNNHLCNVMYIGLRNNTQLEVTHVIQMQRTPPTWWDQVGAM